MEGRCEIQSMEGRFEIRGCSQLELKARKNKTRVCGLWSLPDAVALNCLAQVSRLDHAALAMASKEHRSLVVTNELWHLRWNMGCIEQAVYVLVHIFPEPNPRWFILHPEQRRLKPIHSNWNPAPETGSAFVLWDGGVYVIGGTVNGYRTSGVWFFDCFKHRWSHVPHMKIARSGASASLIDDKIYVFGGCIDSDSWAEVFDLSTRTWSSLNVSRPKKIEIRRSVVIEEKEEVYAVDEDGQSFTFSPSKSIFVANGNTEGGEYTTDWCLFSTFLFCGGTGGSILWCWPNDLDWKKVKGLEELHSRCGDNEITNLCTIAGEESRIVIFWIARRPLGIHEVWSAQISLKCEDNGSEIRGKIEWSGPVLLDSSVSLRLLYAAAVLV